MNSVGIGWRTLGHDMSSQRHILPCAMPGYSLKASGLNMKRETPGDWMLLGSSGESL